MNVLIIPDKFKGSLTAVEVIDAIREGLHRFDSSIRTHAITASDGGDGFLDAIKQSNPSVQTVVCDTTDPLGRPIRAEYGYDATSRAAFVEMAKASGMELLSVAERNPAKTSTHGTGTLIVDAIGRGSRKVYIGLGGSATTDGGIGIGQAVGFRFNDDAGRPVLSVGGALQQIRSVDSANVIPGLADVQIFAVNDVANPLLGPDGAATIYGPQKGADQEMVVTHERGLDNLKKVVRRELKVDVAEVPGAGAAGGTGYGLKAFLGAEFLSGIEFVLASTGIDALLSSGGIDWIVTGEGRIDDQTAYGKLVRGVADVGQKFGVPVVAVCGQLALKDKTVADLGLERAVQIHRTDRPVEYTMQHARDLLITAAQTLSR